MKIVLCIFVFVGFFNGQAQSIIEAMPEEYVETTNYGGKVELKRFLQQEMNYSAKALANKTEGTVELSFVVDRQLGTPGQLYVKTSVSPELDAEAIRLYKLLLFVPAWYMGEKITTRSALKVKFSIKQYQRYCKKRGYDHIDMALTEVDSLFKTYTNNQVKLKPKMVFKDSLTNIYGFIQDHLKYPQGTFRLGVTGVVKLSFVVEASGRITNIRVLRDVAGGANNEAIRILTLTKWEPGEKDGTKVRVNEFFEINFDLNNDSGMDYIPTNY